MQSIACTDASAASIVVTKGDIGEDGCRADCLFVMQCLFAPGGVDDEVDFAVFDDVENVWPSLFANLEYFFAFNSVFPEEAVCALGCNKVEVHAVERTGNVENPVVFVLIVDADEHRA